MKGFNKPRKLYLVKGLREVRFIDTPNFAKTKSKSKGSKRRGLIYQDRVVDYLENKKPDTWEALPGPWFEFEDVNGHGYAQADWLGIDMENGVICIVEIKLNRVADAWWQLNRKYKPLVEKIFPGFNVAMLEIATTVRHFKTPTDVGFISTIEDVEAGKTMFMRVPYEGLQA